MLFNSYTFWVFFGVVLLLYRSLALRQQNYMLLAASWLFYYSLSGWFLVLLIGTSVMDYLLGLRIDSARTDRARKGCLLVSVVVNLGLLGYFKYAGFFTAEAVRLFGAIGINLPLPVLHVILPVGISFYTFQELSYTIDIYRRELRPVRRMSDFMLYVAFFPQLVAGPIERSSRLIPQVLTERRNLRGDFSAGMYLVLSGLFRKVILADNMAGITNAIFSTPADQLSGGECLIGIYAFAFQIYGDFSGYSAIAQGIARWMGFDLMTNFRHPYLAISPSDFWRRWHISLSTWLRDYVYIPLGGNRGSRFATYRNLLLTMFIGGFWHGAAWTFIIWGLFHGLLLCAYRPIERRLATARVPRPLRNARASETSALETFATGTSSSETPASKSPASEAPSFQTPASETLSSQIPSQETPSPRPGARLSSPEALDLENVRPRVASGLRVFKNFALGVAMFHLVCFGWLFFRADSMGQAGVFIERIFTDFRMTDHARYALGMILFLAVPMMIYEYWVDRREDVLALTDVHWIGRGLVYAYCVVMLWVFVPESSHAFIYFQF